MPKLTDEFTPSLRITELNLHTAQIVDIRNAEGTFARLKAIGHSDSDSLNIIRRVSRGHGFETTHAWWRVATPNDDIELLRRKNAEEERNALRLATESEL